MTGGRTQPTGGGTRGGPGEGVGPGVAGFIRGRPTPRLTRPGFPPAATPRLTARSKQSVSSTRSRLFLKVFGRKGTPAEWDEFVMSL